MIDFCILGSGISGSTIASLLNKKYSTEIIDKANGIGGRSSNKKINKSVSFDHGLQYFSPENPKFKKYLEKLTKKKILKLWNGNHIDFTFKNKSNSQKIIGVRGNNDLNKYLIKKIKKKFNQEITNIKFKNTYWEISSKSKIFNAKNIIITFPFEQTKKLAKKYLDNSFLKLKVKMIPNITLMLKQNSKKKVPISSIKLNNRIIAWIANENSKKRFFNKKNYWTIQTSESYSYKIINLYKRKKKFYSNQIVKEISKILNLSSKSFEVYRIHGWKYSFNKISSGMDCYWNKKLGLGLCGDWFIGPKAESAWLSAYSLYNKIKKTRLNY